MLETMLLYEIEVMLYEQLKTDSEMNVINNNFYDLRLV